MAARRKAREARRQRRTRCCRWCCIRLAVVALGSVFSSVLLVLSHMESVQHGKSFAVSHAGSVHHAKKEPEVFERKQKPVTSLLRGAVEKDDDRPPRHSAGERYIPPEKEEVSNDLPSLQEIVSTLRNFLDEVHRAFGRAKRKTREEVWAAYVAVAETHLLPFERRVHKTKRPVRDDGSIFVSHSRVSGPHARQHADGAIHARVKTGIHYCGSGPAELRRKVQDRRPGGQQAGRTGKNESDRRAGRRGRRRGLCASAVGQPHCRAGRVRVLRVNETESLGPAFARYLASKLWLGEQFYVQIDAHMWAREAWDDELRREMMATPSYPRSVMSAYPPGPSNGWQSMAPSGKLVFRYFFHISGGSPHFSVRWRRRRSEHRGASPRTAPIVYLSARASSRHMLVSCKWRPSTRFYLLYLWAKKSCSRRGSIRMALMCTRLESTSSRTSIGLGGWVYQNSGSRRIELLGAVVQYPVHADDRG